MTIKKGTVSEVVDHFLNKGAHSIKNRNSLMSSDGYLTLAPWFCLAQWVTNENHETKVATINVSETANRQITEIVYRVRDTARMRKIPLLIMSLERSVGCSISEHVANARSKLAAWHRCRVEWKRETVLHFAEESLKRAEEVKTFFDIKMPIPTVQHLDARIHAWKMMKEEERERASFLARLEAGLPVELDRPISMSEEDEDALVGIY